MVYVLLLWLLPGQGLVWLITCYYGYYWLGPIMFYFLLPWLLTG